MPLSPCCSLSVTPPALHVGAQGYLHALKGTGANVGGSPRHLLSLTRLQSEGQGRGVGRKGILWGQRTQEVLGGVWGAWDHRLKLTAAAGPEGQGRPVRLSPSHVQWGPTSGGCSQTLS